MADDGTVKYWVEKGRKAGVKAKVIANNCVCMNCKRSMGGVVKTHAGKWFCRDCFFEDENEWLKSEWGKTRGKLGQMMDLLKVHEGEKDDLKRELAVAVKGYEKELGNCIDARLELQDLKEHGVYEGARLEGKREAAGRPSKKREPLVCECGHMDIDHYVRGEHHSRSGCNVFCDCDGFKEIKPKDKEGK